MQRLIRVAQIQFRTLNSDKTLSAADRKQLKSFFLGRITRALEEPPGRKALPDRLLTAKELENWLGIDRQTIYNYAQRGFLPHIRANSNVRFERRAIARWVNNHRRGLQGKARRTHVA
jgi:predicted DNA-binding transcriptional regulator AlpA